MPIELLYTDREIIKIQSQLLRKYILTQEELELLKEIQEYLNK